MAWLLSTSSWMRARAAALTLSLAATLTCGAAEAGTTASAGSSNTVPTRDPRRSHWAFQAIRKQVPPVQLSADRSEASSNPIDAFIAQRLRDKGLPLPQVANRRALIRRVTYDLTGLPPTP